MKIYVAYRTDRGGFEKTASGSMTLLKGFMKGTHNSGGEALTRSALKSAKESVENAEYTVVLYDFKPNLANVCQAITDVTELEALWSLDFKISDNGQLREVKS